MTLMPAIPGMRVSSSFWSLPNTDATSSSNARGSTNEKKAALGLRQKSLRSSRNCSQASAMGVTRHLLAGRVRCRRLLLRQLKVDVLERGTGYLESLQPLSSCERVTRQAVQKIRGVIGPVLHTPAARAIGDPVSAAARTEIGRRPLGHDGAVLDDGHAVRKSLGLVQVVGG